MENEYQIKVDENMVTIKVDRIHKEYIECTRLIDLSTGDFYNDDSYYLVVAKDNYKDLPFVTLINLGYIDKFKENLVVDKTGFYYFHYSIAIHFDFERMDIIKKKEFYDEDEVIKVYPYKGDFIVLKEHSVVSYDKELSTNWTFTKKDKDSDSVFASLKIDPNGIITLLDSENNISLIDIEKMSMFAKLN